MIDFFVIVPPIKWTRKPINKPSIDGTVVSEKEVYVVSTETIDAAIHATKGRTFTLRSLS
jgi:hypothetical protein